MIDGVVTSSVSGIEDSWENEDSPWWVKANQAARHVASLRNQIADYRASHPYSVTPEPTDDPNRTAYRLSIAPVPAGISATVGDVLYNLRSALESLAFELARRSNGGVLTARQERDSTFPVCTTPENFDAFIQRAGSLYDDRARTALRSAQPFAVAEQAKLLGVASGRPYEERSREEVLYRLDELAKLDRHRRLALLAWWPDIVYWTSNGPTGRRAFPGDGTLEDGSVLLYIDGHDVDQDNQLHHEFNLVLQDDPAHAHGKGLSSDVVEVLERWHYGVTVWTFGRIFAAMSRSDLPNVGHSAGPTP